VAVLLEHQYSETSGAKAQFGSDHVLADSLARNLAIACQCSGAPGNEMIVDHPRLFCPSP